MVLLKFKIFRIGIVRTGTLLSYLYVLSFAPVISFLIFMSLFTLYSFFQQTPLGVGLRAGDGDL